MANLNKKHKQGKTPQQYKDSSSFAWYGVVGMIIILTLTILMSGCVGTYYISDAQYDNAREEHLAITYHNSYVYWGWQDGWWYYYGVPHQNPWYYYYNVCPPSHYHINTHIKINKPKKIIVHRNSNLTSKPHRDNRVLKNNNKSNRNIKVTPNKTTNTIKINNGSKRTNKTTIKRKPKK
tara:strand:+ start:1748 stop:2284 length:537 start_codon:yes stop_codon:yes gene_type:complete